MRFLALVVFINLFGIFYLNATPSTQIWIPSTDIQGFKTFHLGIDNYFRTENINGNRGAGIYDLGLTTGILPFGKIQSEIGFDYLYMGDPIYDQHPFYFNMKIGTPEDSIFKYAPAIAFGAFNVGFMPGLTNYNIIYGVIAKTIPVIGRVTIGYYFGNDKVLVDEKGKSSKDGILASFDRQIPEISDKLWFGADYQGGKNSLGSFNFGFSWSFAPNTSVILGYCIYNNKNAYYNSKDVNVNAITTQLDINF
jgi:hypothetical protein